MFFFRHKYYPCSFFAIEIEIYATCARVYSLVENSTMTPFKTFNNGIVSSFLKVQNVF